MTVKRKLLLVEWVDSCSPNGWADTKSIEREYTPDNIRSVGWLIREDRKSLTIAAHESTGQLDGVMSIPKAAVTSRKVISGG